MYAIVAAALAVLVFVIVGPFTLASTGAWILAAVAAVAFAWAFTSYSRRTGLQVALVGLIAALMIFTVRAGVLSSLDQGGIPASEASYSPGLSQNDHGALPVELLVYTQTSGDIPILVDKLAQYAKQTGKGVDQPVVVDSVDGYTWPWAWYLRNYTDVQYANIAQGYTAAGRRRALHRLAGRGQPQPRRWLQPRRPVPPSPLVPGGLSRHERHLLDPRLLQRPLLEDAAE